MRQILWSFSFGDPVKRSKVFRLSTCVSEIPRKIPKKALMIL